MAAVVVYSNKRCTVPQRANMSSSIFTSIPHVIRLHETEVVGETALTQSPRQRGFMWMHMEQNLF